MSNSDIDALNQRVFLTKVLQHAGGDCTLQSNSENRRHRYGHKSWFNID